MSSEGTHRRHCCRRHGCKYGHSNCPVTTGEVDQDYPCEHCGDEAEMTAELIDDRLREMPVSELFLELAVASKALGHTSTKPVEVTVLHPDGQPMLTLSRLRVRVRGDRVVIETQEPVEDGR